MSDEFDDDEPDLEDAMENAWERCGSRRKKQCDLAGTEFCDWTCPMHDEVFGIKRTSGPAA